jgi:hypothetical protein
MKGRGRRVQNKRKGGHRMRGRRRWLMVMLE